MEKTGSTAHCTLENWVNNRCLPWLLTGHCQPGSCNNPNYRGQLSVYAAIRVSYGGHDTERPRKRTTGTSRRILRNQTSTHGEKLHCITIPNKYRNVWLRNSQEEYSWEAKKEEFKLLGPDSFTTSSDCIVPPRSQHGYKDRIYVPGWRTVRHYDSMGV